MTHKKQDLFDFYVGKYIAGIPPSIFTKILRGEHDTLYAKETHGFILLALRNSISGCNDYYAKKVGTKIDCICKYYYNDALNFDKAELKNMLKYPQRYCNKINECAFNGLRSINNSCATCHLSALRAYQNGTLFLKSEREVANDS